MNKALTSWLVIVDHNRVDVVLGNDPSVDYWSDYEIEHPVRDGIHLALGKQALVSQASVN